MPTPALLHWRCTETSNAVAISYQLVPPGTKVYVALSGGPDSMALLHLALHRGDICLLGAVHINHNLRQTALRDQQHCQAWCMYYGEAEELVKKMDGKTRWALYTQGE